MVAYKAPVDVIAGVTAGFTSGVNTATFEDFKGWEVIPNRIGLGPQIPGTDYTWDATTGRIVLLKTGDTFQDGEAWHFEFQVKFSGTIGQANYNSGAVKQYPHTLVIKTANWATEENEVVTYMCRREGGQEAKKGFNHTDQTVNYVLYMPLPVDTIQIGTPVEVYAEDNELLAADAVKQFSRGQLNARAWI